MQHLFSLILNHNSIHTLKEKKIQDLFVTAYNKDISVFLISYDCFLKINELIRNTVKETLPELCKVCNSHDCILRWSN